MKNFITFEGGEGCGKTTLIGKLHKYCLDNGIDSLITREPGGIKECEEIRNMLKSTKDFSVKTQVLLFSASRSHLCEHVIKPSLEQGKIVFCDRFYDSTRVYQGMNGNIDDSLIMQITNFAVGDIKPQITFFLDIDPVVAFKRKGGADKGDVFEEAGIEFHQKVRENFKLLAKKEPERFVLIDASLSADEVFQNVLDILKKEKVINA